MEGQVLILIVIPAYNEEGNLRSLIQRINSALRNAKLEYKVLAVNDGSKDNTESVLVELSKDFPIQILRHEVNKGVGAVFTTGLSAAAKQAKPDDIIVIMEADGTNDPVLIPEMYTKIDKKECDVVIGSRYQKGGSYHKFPLKRFILSNGANLLFRILFPIRNVRDYTIFFRAYSARLIRAAFDFYKDSLIDTKTFVCNAALLVKMRRFNIRAEEIPMVYRYDLKKGRSKMNITATLKEYMEFIIKELKKRNQK